MTYRSGNTSRVALDRIMQMVFQASGLFCIAILGGILLMLLFNSVLFFAKVPLQSFFGELTWQPEYDKYGIWSLLAGTLLTTLGAMVIAVPIGIGTAVYLSEYASPSVRSLLKPAVEMLAAVPSVVIGFIGIVVVSPAIMMLTGASNGLNALNGSVLLAIMALPTIVAVSEDAIRAVPTVLREASYGLGATKWTTLRMVVVPAAYPGIIAAVMLGMGRAIGETMTVLMATGNAAAFPKGFFSPVRTITANIAIEMGEVPFFSVHYYGLFATALVLFILSFAINLLAERVVARIRRFQ
ncbi:MAG: phosphate ABC transporter permease subunit PstC [Cytophagales bacterium]|nr:phosphate ABC transporter permease subunit PstC [Bernardetiaceae bacterium]MDW8211422.1 phosphate ABC transporter permease subunit PstC [Cytophagales bacterium]